MVKDSSFFQVFRVGIVLLVGVFFPTFLSAADLPTAAPSPLTQGVGQWMSQLTPPKVDSTYTIPPNLEGGVMSACMNVQGALQAWTTQGSNLLVAKMNQSSMNRPGGVAPSLTGQIAAGLTDAPSGFICAEGVSVNLDIPCPLVPTQFLEDPRLQTCEPRLSEFELKAKRAQLQGPYCSIQCQLAKVSAVNQAVSCLTARSSALLGALSGMLPKYQTVLSEANQKVQKVQSLRLATEAQMKDVSSKMSNLQKARDSLSQFVQGLPAGVARLDQQQTKLLQDQKTLSQQAQIRGLALVSDCFTSTQISPADYRCEVNGPVVSPQEYLVCLYRKAQGTPGNQLQNSAFVAAGARGNAGALQTVLDNLLKTLPSGASSPQNAAQVFAGSGSTPAIQNVDQLMSRYGASLKSLGSVRGVGVDTYVRSVLTQCQKVSQNQVQAEQQSPSSALGAAAADLQMRQKAVGAEVNALFNQSNQLYANSISQMGTPPQAPLVDSKNCPMGTVTDSSQKNIQMSCLRATQDRLQGLLNGSDQSRVKFSIQGNTGLGETEVQLPCVGMNGCLQVLQTASRDLTTQQTQLQIAEKQYILATNQALQNSATTLTQNLGVQSLQMSQEVSRIMAALSSLKVGMPNVSGLSGSHAGSAGWTTNPTTGLLQPPTTSQLAAMVTPPILDPNTSGLAGIPAQLGAQRSTWEQTQATLNREVSYIDGYRARCNQMLGSLGSVQEAVNSLELLKNSRCTQAECNQYGHVRVLEEIQALRSVMMQQSSGSLDPRVRTQIGSVQTGIALICMPPAATNNTGIMMMAQQPCTPGLFTDVLSKLQVAKQEAGMAGRAGSGM